MRRAWNIGTLTALRIVACGTQSATGGSYTRSGLRFVWPAWLLLLLVAGGLVSPLNAQPLNSGDLSKEEAAFLKLTIDRWRFLDVARRWIKDRQETVSSRTARGDLEYALADCLKYEGKTDEFAAEIQRLAKKYPNHPLSQSAGLLDIKTKMLDVINKHGEALEQPDPALRKKLFAERDRIYQEEVVGPLNKSIEKVNEEVDAGAADAEATRDEWEHYRVLAARSYAQRMEPGTDGHKAAWEQCRDVASAFVADRFDNFARQCECQLIYAQALAALGEVEEAAGEFDLLVEITPPMDPPYAEAAINFILWLRIQAIEGTARAYNQIGQPTKAVEVFDRVRANQSPEFNLSTAGERPSLVSLALSMEIEEAIARAAGGDDDQGIRKFEELLAKWGAEGQVDVTTASGNMIAIAQGLSRLLDTGAGNLPPLFYRHAGTGYQVRGKMKHAIKAWKVGLSVASPRQSEQALCAEMLNQIGQTYLLRGQIPEAAFAFATVMEVYRSVASEKDRALASQNAFATFSDLAVRGKAWEEMAEVAQVWFSREGTGEAAQLLLLQQASELEAKGDYAGARRKYHQLIKEIDGKRNPHYVKGRAGGARCLFLKERAAGKAAEGAAAAIKELDLELSDAKSRSDADGQAILIYEKASILWDDEIKDREKALAALAPLGSEVASKTQARELGLNLWINILLPDETTAAMGDELSQADAQFAVLRREFPQSIYLPDLCVSLMAAHGGVGAPENRKKAADYAEAFVTLPGANLKDMKPAGVLFFADALINGGKLAKAKEILLPVQERMGDSADADLDVAVNLQLARVLVESGDADQALVKLRDLLKRHGTKIRSGELDEAPAVYSTKARAILKQYEKKRDAKLLKEAEEDLSACVGILETRRRSIRLSGNKVPPTLERAYWNGWVQLLELYKTQDRKPLVLKQIRTFGDTGSTIPNDIQERLEQLRKECER